MARLPLRPHHVRLFTRFSSTSTSPPKPRHLLTIGDLTPPELSTLINNATHYRSILRSPNPTLGSLSTSLRSRTLSLLFSKRSTRTRVSTESAITALGGHPMFLGSSDIQLGVNESLYDTAKIISSMTAGIIARVGPHKDIADLARDSDVPVINALCDRFHPMQIVADFATVGQVLGRRAEELAGLKVAWVGDANNVLFDMLIAAGKLDVRMSVATPTGYEVPQEMKDIIAEAGGAKFEETTVPEEAVKGADVIVTDTWVSMGQEKEKQERMKAFDGYQVTEELGRRGGANKDWKFMHCLPRHPEEVSDEVFYGPRSVVFQEGENRLYSAIATLEAFIVNKGEVKRAV